jgi:hypothetical protein
MADSKTPDAAIPETVIPPVAGPASRARAHDQATAAAEAAAAEAETAEARAAIVKAHDPVPLNLPETDALGRRLPRNDPAKARAMQREAAIERQRRSIEDVDRVTHGLEPKYATE